METINNPSNNPPDNYLVWAILSTFLCCTPLGIIAIIKSTKVNQLWAQGDYAGARNAADEAKKWAIWAAIIGPIMMVILFVLLFMILGMGSVLTNG